MKVYRIDALAKPQERGWKEFAGLVADDAVWEYITPRGEGLDGRPFTRHWKTQTFYYNKPLAPKPNFLWIGPSAFVCDERAREIAAEPMEMSGEFLPIRVEREPGKYWIYNITNSITVVDHKASKWEKLGPTAEDRILKRAAFVASHFGEETLFKIPEDRGASIYCVEFSSDPDDGEFKALVEHHQLTGLAFELIWSG